jgi:hypothetical protein
MKKIGLPIAIVFIVAMGAIIAVNRSQAKYSQKPSETKSDKTAVPDHIFYGETLSLLAKHKNIEDYQRRAGFSHEEAELLLAIAQQCLAKLDQQDAAAKNVIVNAKIEMNASDPRRAPAPPAILFELQKQRNAIVLDCRDRLNNELGSQKFEQFRQAANSLVQISFSPAK